MDNQTINFSDRVDVIRCTNCRFCANTAVENIKFCIIWNKYVKQK